MRLYVSLAAVAATLAAATPAVAQSTGSVTTQAWAKGTVVQPVTLTWQQDLDFGTVVSTGTAGNVVINANTGARTIPSGGPIGVPSYPGDRGLFQGGGTAGQTVDLTLNAPSFLISTANVLDTITVNSMELDGCACTSDSRVIGASGVFNVGVGGDFQIGINQPAALYRARYDVTAVYP
jgi:hypothetical protein